MKNPSLVLRLHDGWRADGQHFISPSGETVEWGDPLPEGSRIVAMVPDLAEAPPESLSPDDFNLAHYAHLILPEPHRGVEYMVDVQRWEAVETVAFSPQISLP